MRSLETLYKEALFEMKNVCSDIINDENLTSSEQNDKQNGIDEILELNENI